MSKHNVPFNMHHADWEILDPGTGNSIPVDKNGIMAFSTGASGETNTLARPTAMGQRLTLFMVADGGGDRVITADGIFDESSNNTATFDAAQEMLVLESVPTATSGVYEWRRTYNTCTLSTV